MLRAFAVLVSILVLLIVPATVPVFGQGVSHPDDPAAVVLGTFGCTADFTGGGSGEGGDLYLPENAGSECRTQFEVCVWRTSGNRIDYVIRPATISFSAGCDAGIDALQNHELFDAFARAAARRGAALGYVSCSSLCSAGDTCRVLQASCVLRTGSGAAAAFTPCDSNAYCARTYVVCCPVGENTPSAHLVPPSGTTTCSPLGQYLAGCEVTCP